MPLLLNGIVMWSGALNEIPTGWSLCDGTNGTPDLRNKFIIGSGGSFSFEDTGGFVDATLASHSHTMSGSSGSGGMPSHTHSVSAFDASASPQFNARTRGAGVFSSVNSNQAGAHGHSATLAQAGQGENGVEKNLPPYYALAFIMQTD